MTEETGDRELYDLVRRAIVPRGHRPATLAEIEAMLRACAGAPMAEDVVERMLRKAKGLEPVGRARPTLKADDLVTAPFDEALTEQQRELVALHRAQGKTLPPEIAALLARLRSEAKSEHEQPDLTKGRHDGEPV